MATLSKTMETLSAAHCVSVWPDRQAQSALQRPLSKARAPQTHLAASCVKFRRSRQQCVSRWKDTLPLGHTITKNTECKTKSLWVELPVFSVPGGQKMCSLHRRDACHTTLWKIYRIKVPVSSANEGQGKYCKDLGGAFSCIS